MTSARGYRVVVLLIASLCAGAPRSARATEPDSDAAAEKAVLRFTPAAQCPDRTEFIRRVHRHTSKAEFVAEGDTERTFALSISRTPETFTGTLEIQQNSQRATRSVSGKTCDEVVDALALMTALSIDPASLGGGAEPGTPEKSPPNAAPVKRLPRRAVRPVAPDPVQWSLGAEALAAAGLFPKVALGGAVLAQLRTSTLARWRATFAIGFHYLDGGHQSALGAVVEHAALGAQLQGCLELAVSNHWAPALCMNALLGRTRSKVQAAANVRASNGSRDWAGLFWGPRLDWQIVGPLALRVEAAVGVHLIEQRVILVGVEPDGQPRQVLLNDTTGLVGSAGIGLLCHL